MFIHVRYLSFHVDHIDILASLVFYIDVATPRNSNFLIPNITFQKGMIYMKHNLKKLIGAILLFALVFSLVACGETASELPTPTETEAVTTTETPMETTTAPEETTEALSTETDISTEPTEERVSADRQEDYTPTGEVTANVVDALNETYTIAQVVYSRVLPQIDLPGPNVEAINEEILRDYTTDFYTANYANIYYEWAVKDDVLSVVIVGSGSMFDGGWEEEGYGCDAFSVYNISISKCRLLKDEEVYAAAGMADPEVQVLNAIVHYGARWKGRNEGGKQLFFGNPDNSNEIRAIEETISHENFLQAKPYFDKDGNLNVMGYVVTNIGAGGFYGFVPVYEYENTPLLTAEEYYGTFYEQYNK